MAWIESHQELRHHPKTRKLARLLNVELAQAIGHLHCLWWWAFDYAADGDLTRFDADEIADASEWHGDASVYVHALTTCTFITNGHIHDWHTYTGRYGLMRQKNAERQRAYREKNRVHTPPNDDVPPRNENVTRTKTARTGATRPDQTIPNQTITPLESPPSGGDQPSDVEPRPTARRIPDDFTLTDARLAYAESKGFDAFATTEMFEHFRSYHEAKGSRMVKWEQAWQTWVLNQQRFSARGSKPNGTNGTRQSESQELRHLRSLPPEQLSDFDRERLAKASGKR